MYLVFSEFLKSSKLTNSLEILDTGNLKKNFDLGSPYDATIDIDNFLFH
jgi:hypothetical protein